MKKISLLIVSIHFCICMIAQEKDLKQRFSNFPYQQAADVATTLTAMEQWKSSDWFSFWKELNQEQSFTAASYAFTAYVHHVANNEALRKSLSAYITKALPSTQLAAAKRLQLQQLGLLGVPSSIKAISSCLFDSVFCSDASMSIATIGGATAKKYLQQALKNAGITEQNSIQSALRYLSTQPPVNTNHTLPLPTTTVNYTQQLLQIQDQMEKATYPVDQRRLLNQAEKIPGIGAFAFVGKYLNNADLEHQAAAILIRQSLADKSLKGPMVNDMLLEACKKLQGDDSAILLKLSASRLQEISTDYGYISLFNGKDLTGWKGLVANPIARKKMHPDSLAAAQAKANQNMVNDWVVKDGLLIFTGHGENLATEKNYRNIELWVDWKITEKGDAGIYLRGSPQVQIWDTSRKEVGAQVGSGGLYNNTTHPSKPVQVADNPIGTWNTFRIIMKGEKVTVYLNGIKVTDEVTLENYWDRKQPIFPEEQIELQAHGTYVAYRNIYLRPLPEEDTLVSGEEKTAGFLPLFNGKDLTGWIGNIAGYQAEAGAIVVHPEKSGGNLYTENTYSDFVLRFDFQLTPGANNGIGIRAPLTGDAAYEGMEIQVLDSEHPKYSKLQPYQYHGSVYGVIPAKRGYLLPTGEWNREEIMIQGNHIQVTLNGTVITEGDLAIAAQNGTIDHKAHPGLQRKEGHIGFLGHGDVVRFKNLRIKKL